MNTGVYNIFWRELRFRSVSFALGVLGVAAVAACLIGSRAFLAAHDHKTDELTGALEERAMQRMAQLRDEARKFSKNLGFNCMLLPAEQHLGDLYAHGKSRHFFSEADVAALADAQFETLNHMRPILRERVQWPERKRQIILVGVRGEVYIKAPRWQKPIEESIASGKAHLGRALAEAFDLQPGDSIVFMGEPFTVEHILPQTGNEDDLALRINLETAQRLLDKAGKISAVLALTCNCADGDPEIVRLELEKHLAGVQFIDFTVQARARKIARSAISKGTVDEVEDIKSSRAALRTQIATFANVLIGLVSIGTVILLGVLTFNNARERDGEVAMLRALGLSVGKILGLFLAKASLTGLAGGILGCLTGLLGTRLIIGPAAVVAPHFLVVTVAASIGIAILTSLIPAATAAGRDPAGILNRE